MKKTRGYIERNWRMEGEERGREIKNGEEGGEGVTGREEEDEEEEKR